MSDSVLLVIGVLLAAVVVGGCLRLLSVRATQRIAELVGIEFPAVVFFGSEDCSSCRPARAALSAAGIRFSEMTWESDSAQFEALDIAEVPTTWVVDEMGRIRSEISGTPTAWDLRKAKLQLSAK